MSTIRDLLQDHLFDQAPIAIAVLDQEFRVLEANAKFRQVFGAWEGRRCYDLLKGRKKPCEGCVLRKSLADGKARIREDWLRTGTALTSSFVVRVAPLAWRDPPSTPYAIWMASDVNEAEGLEREHELLFERAPCYITVLDRDLEVIRANRRMRETFGIARGKRCYEIYKRRNRPCRECPALQAFADGKDHTSTQIGVRASGEEVHYLVTASPLSWENGREGGRVKYVIEMATDVTQLRALEREKLEVERLAAVGQTVAGLAHGIKNILMGLEGGAYVMESGLRQNQAGKVEQGMQMLRRNLEKVSRLVRDLLSFSKGRVPHVVLIDPNAAAREILELYDDMARKAGIQLLGDLRPELALAPLDVEGIHTCLANLISNAIDACQMSEKRGCQVHLRTRERDGVLVFEVTDDGCGMDYEMKQKIFTTFFTTKGEGGTGLGLLMTRKIVQEHGGRIELESQPGRGTTFRILLPRDRLPQPPADTQGDVARCEGEREAA
jgi:signal transduction histidine kinase